MSTSVSPHGSPLRLQRPICVISTLRVHQRRFIMALSACKRAMAPFISPWLWRRGGFIWCPISRAIIPNHHTNTTTRQGWANCCDKRPSTHYYRVSFINHHVRFIYLLAACTDAQTASHCMPWQLFQRCRLLAPCGHVHSIKNRGMSAVASLFHINKKHTRRAPNAAAGLRLTPISLRTIGYHTSIPFKNARHAYGAPQFSAQFSADSVVCALH